MTDLRMGSLFAGIGGFDLGFELNGIQPVWAVEIDPHCQRVLRHHWPELHIEADVRDVGTHNLEPVDIITFGSPCQDLSVAGKRKGFAGERSGLYFEAIRIISELDPAVAVWENVVGALSSHAGRDFGRALDELAVIGALDIAWTVLDAQWFGVAQRRRRVFVVADFRGERAAEILALADGLSGHPAPSREAREDIAGTITQGFGTGGAEPNKAESLIAFQCQGTNVGPMGTLRQGSGSVTGGVPFVAESVASTLSASYAKGTGHNGQDDNIIAFDAQQVTSVANRQRLVAGGPAPTLHQAGGAHIIEATPIQNATRGKDQNGLGVGRGDDPMYTLDGASHHAVAFSCKDSGNDATTEMAPTLRAMPHDTSHSNGGGQVAVAFDWYASPSQSMNPSDVSASLKTTMQPAALDRMAVRRLTPRECERLQAFPDDWTLVDGMSDSARYRMLGNAVNVAVSAWLGEQIISVLNRESEVAA